MFGTAVSSGAFIGTLQPMEAPQGRAIYPILLLVARAAVATLQTQSCRPGYQDSQSIRSDQSSKALDKLEIDDNDDD